jgi:hypothetical protein
MSVRLLAAPNTALGKPTAPTAMGPESSFSLTDSLDNQTRVRLHDRSTGDLAVQLYRGQNVVRWEYRLFRWLRPTSWLLSIESSSEQQQQQPPPRPWQSELAAARTREQAKDTVWALWAHRPMYVQSYSRTYYSSRTRDCQPSTVEKRALALVDFT